METGVPPMPGPQQQLGQKIQLALQLQEGGAFAKAIDIWDSIIAATAIVPPENIQEIALRNKAYCCQQMGDYTTAYRLSEEAFTLAHKLGNVTNQCILLEYMGNCCTHLDQPDPARKFYELRLQLAYSSENKPLLASALYDLGTLCAQSGQYRASLSLFTEALIYFTANGDNQINTVIQENILLLQKAIGDKFLHYVSLLISKLEIPGSDQQPPKEGLSVDAANFTQVAPQQADLIAPHQPIAEIPGTLSETDCKEGILYGLLALAPLLPFVKAFTAPIDYAALQEVSDGRVLRLVGEILRTLDADNLADPENLFAAARSITQVKRNAKANEILRQIQNGYTAPDITGTGSGKYILYLRSFITASMLPGYQLDPWGTIHLEEVLASRLEQGPWPLVALGKPAILNFGAGKIQTPDATWQKNLTALGEQATCIIVVPCSTEGTCWEIEWVVIQKLLRKSVFVMPPSEGEQTTWWKEKWAALQRWSKYLGLSFPDYTATGLFFALGPEGNMATAGYGEILRHDALLHLALLKVLGQFIPSTEWLEGIRDSLPAIINEKEAAAKGIDRDALIQEGVDRHAARIEARIKPISLATSNGPAPFLLGMMERGIEAAFAHWPQQPARLSHITGVYTVWDGNTLVSAAAANDLFIALDAYAEGKFENSMAASLFFDTVIEPGLNTETRQYAAKGLLPKDKMTRFYVRRNLRYRFIGCSSSDAILYADLIRNGVLDAGKPKLEI